MYKRRLSYFTFLGAYLIRHQLYLFLHRLSQFFAKMFLKLLFSFVPLFTAAATLANGYVVPEEYRTWIVQD